MSVEFPMNFRSVSLRHMSEGEEYLVQIVENGYSQSALCQLITIERGLVKGKIVKTYKPKGHHSFARLVVGNEMSNRAKSCFLWGKSDEDKWPRYHWFKNLDDIVT